MTEYKAVQFEVGDIVTGKFSTGIPASPRNFQPLKDRAKEFSEYKKLEVDYIESKGKDTRAGKFSIKMVYPPHERGGRYRIIEGEEYKILVAGEYVFFNVKSKTKSKSTV